MPVCPNRQPVTIALKGGHTVLIDQEDLELVSQYNWNPFHRPRQNTYVARGYKKHGRQKFVYMHRVIMGVTDPSIDVDHRDHQGLNNQKHNLRTCTRTQNNWNKGMRKDNTSGYTGVVKAGTNKAGEQLWVAVMKINGKIHRLEKPTTDIKKCALAYQLVATLLRGEFHYQPTSPGK